MQMIDLMKRLAELDAKKSNNVKQGMKEGLDECGIMPASSSMGMPRTPASIHITADSGSELTAMLRDIASLAGMKDHHTGGDDSILPGNGSLEIEPLSVEPTDMGPPEPSMRSMIDKLNPSDEKAEETINSEPDPMSAGKVPANQDPAGTPGAAQGRNQMNNPVATPMSSEEEVYETLKQDYQKFLTDARYGGRSSWDTSSTGWQSDEERRGRYKERDFAHGAQDIEPETKTPAPKGMLYGFYDALGQKWLSSQSGQSPIKVPRRVAYDDSDATKGILGFNNKEAAEKAKNSVTPLMSRDSNPHPYSVELFRSTENGLSDVKELDEQMVEDSHNRLREGNEKSDPEADDFYNTVS